VRWRYFWFLIALNAGHVYFNFNDAGVNAIDGGAEGFIEHLCARLAVTQYSIKVQTVCDGYHSYGVICDLVEIFVPNSRFEITKCDLQGWSTL